MKRLLRICLYALPLMAFTITGCGPEHKKEGAKEPSASGDISKFIIYKTEIPAPRNPVCEDFNSDGLTDVAVIEKPPFLNVFLNSKEGLMPPVRYNANTHNLWLTAIDIDSNGLKDLMPITESLIGPAFYNKGGGMFESFSMNERAPEFGYFITTGDLDGDGREDLVALGLKSGDIKIMFNRGANTFQPEMLHTPNVKTPLGGAGLREALIYDINSDGLKDIVVADYSGQRVLAAINSPDAKFKLETLKSFDSTVSSIGIFRSNGKNFIAAALESIKKAVIMEDTGNLNFKIIKEFALDGPPRRIEVKDIDGDGTEDIIIAINTRNSSGYFIRVVYNPASAENMKSIETFLPGYDCTYFSICNIYGTNDFLCSDLNRGQFFILKKEFLGR